MHSDFAISCHKVGQPETQLEWHYDMHMMKCICIELTVFQKTICFKTNYNARLAGDVISVVRGDDKDMQYNRKQFNTQ